MYACESWTLTVGQRKITTVEMRFLSGLLGTSYRDHIKNEEVRNRISQQIRLHDNLLTTIKKRKLKWCGHITRTNKRDKECFRKLSRAKRGEQSKRRNWQTTSTNTQEKILPQPKPYPMTTVSGNNFLNGQLYSTLTSKLSMGSLTFFLLVFFLYHKEFLSYSLNQFVVLLLTSSIVPSTF